VVDPHTLADFLSRSINPALCLLILEEPLLDRRAGREPWPLFWVRCAAAIGIAVTLAEMGKHHEVWSGHPMFPSGHTTGATAAAACLVLRRGLRWLWIAVPAVVLMAVSLVYGRWHTTAEVLGGFVLALVITLACFRVFSRLAEPK
jgi:membrane-associated phospholipid phosphatase